MDQLQFMTIKFFNSSFMSKERIQKNEIGIYFEVSATQASSVTLTKEAKKAYCNFFILIRQSIQRLTRIVKSANYLKAMILNKRLNQ